MELQTTEQQNFQRREWTAQKVGTMMLFAFIIAALLGVVGSGPLASAERSGPEGLVTVELDYVIRLDNEDDVTMSFSSQAVKDSTITVELTGPWTSGIDLQSIAPEPTEQQLIADGVEMTFEAEPASQTDVSFSFAARELFILEGQATVRGDTVSMTQFVLP